MIKAFEELEGAGLTERPQVVLADAGYRSNGHIDSLRERVMTPIVAPDTTRDRPRRHASAGHMTSCEECSPPSLVALSTHKDSG